VAFLRISINMKRLNPKTGKLFKHGDVRDDGYLFHKYAAHKPVKKDGYFQENWLAPEKWEAQKERCRQMNKKLYEINPEIKKEQNRIYRKENLEYFKKANRKWKEKNPHKQLAYNGKRRAAKLLRTPNWLTADDLFIIEEVYHLAKLRTELTGIPHHVDHILPLQGKIVSGLHVPANLQVIPAKINLQKSNKHE
jgi:hypothetical protein